MIWIRTLVVVIDMTILANHACTHISIGMAGTAVNALVSTSQRERGSCMVKCTGSRTCRVTSVTSYTIISISSNTGMLIVYVGFVVMSMAVNAAIQCIIRSVGMAFGT